MASRGQTFVDDDPHYHQDGDSKTKTRQSQNEFNQSEVTPGLAACPPKGTLALGFADVAAYQTFDTANPGASIP